MFAATTVSFDSCATDFSRSTQTSSKRKDPHGDENTAICFVSSTTDGSASAVPSPSTSRASSLPLLDRLSPSKQLNKSPWCCFFSTFFVKMLCWSLASSPHLFFPLLCCVAAGERNEGFGAGAAARIHIYPQHAAANLPQLWLQGGLISLLSLHLKVVLWSRESHLPSFLLMLWILSLSCLVSYLCGLLKCAGFHPCD